MDGEKTKLIEKEEKKGKEVTTEVAKDDATTDQVVEEYDPDKSGAGPIKDRSCTDILCLALLICFAVLWVLIAVWGVRNGDPTKLMYPTNSFGQICGQGELADKPFLLFFDLTKCISLSALTGCPTPQVCVEQCPSDSFSPWMESQLPIPEVPSILGGVSVKDRMKPFCTQDMTEDILTRLSVGQLVERKYCPPWWVHSSNILGRCLPSLTSTTPGNNSGPIPSSETGVVFSDSPTGEISLETLERAVEALSKALGLRSLGDKIIADLSASWWFIVSGIFLSMLICLVWIVLMRWTAGFLVWTSMLGTMIVLTFVTNTAYTKYSTMPEDMTPFPWSLNPGDYLERRGTWFFILILSGSFLTLLLLVTVSMRNRVAIAIELIEEGSVACSQMLCTLFFPPLPFVLQGVVLIWGFVIGIFLLTSSSREYRVVMEEDEDRLLDCGNDCWNPSTNLSFNLGEECTAWADNFTSVCNCSTVGCHFFRYGPSTLAQSLQLINLFGIFWGIFFMEAFGQLVLAGAFAGWYWTFKKPENLPTNGLSASFHRSVRYHLGTVAFGSLIIAILRMIRVILEKIEGKLAKYHQDNIVVKGVMCVCKCCFWCLEKFMRFLNRNAYIMCAVQGTNFCSSAKDAFFLLLRNVARLAVLTGVTNFLMFLSKIVVVGICAALSYILFSGSIKEVSSELPLPPLNFPLLPTILISLAAYLISSCFFSVYEMAIDTLFLCFLQDSEINDGSKEKPYYMSRKLMKILGKKNVVDEETSKTK